MSEQEAAFADETKRLHEIILAQQGEIDVLKVEIATRHLRDRAIIELVSVAMHLPPQIVIEDAATFGNVG